MVTYSDREYKFTKLIKQGKKTMNKDFIELADWIYSTYQIKPLNIIYDTFVVAYHKRSRLQVIFEFSSEREKFINNDGNFDNIKQEAIRKQFEKIMILARYEPDNMHVVFSAFEPVAIEETFGLIPEESVEEFKKQLNNPELWGIAPGNRTKIFFFFTDKQVEKNTRNGLRDIITDKFYNLLKKYDEFGYNKKEEFSVVFDSKENFDANYEGNWFYYYR